MNCIACWDILGWGKGERVGWMDGWMDAGVLGIWLGGVVVWVLCAFRD